MTPRHPGRRLLTTALGSALLVATAACGVSPDRADPGAAPRAADGAGAPAGAGCTTSGPGVTAAYRTVPGVDPNATSLDVHPLGADCDAPVVVWVHGGGYHNGDKSQGVKDKIKLFNGRGWLFVSVNYRLTDEDDGPGSARFPDHYEDVAAAVAWVHAHIAEHGGDPARIAVLGHSAGADIVSNVTVRPQYLGGHSLPLSTVRCAGVLDTAGFDKTAVPADAAERRQWEHALGNNADYLTQASAVRWVAPGIGIPATIVVVRGTQSRQDIQNGYREALRAAGVSAPGIDARSLSHEEVKTRIGAPGDTVMTPPLVEFLTGCLDR